MVAHFKHPDIDKGKFKNGTELARAIGREPGKVAWTMRLAMLAPDIVHRILEGDIPQNLTLEKLRVPLPDLWEDSARCCSENNQVGSQAVGQ